MSHARGTAAPRLTTDAAFWHKRAELWHARAEEARVQASEMHDAGAQRLMLGIAENYDQLARRADALSKSKSTPPTA
jgi:hypothetical protein